MIHNTYSSMISITIKNDCIYIKQEKDVVLVPCIYDVHRLVEFIKKEEIGKFGSIELRRGIVMLLLIQRHETIGIDYDKVTSFTSELLDKYNEYLEAQ